MKITKSQLKQIIKEELQLLSEDEERAKRAFYRQGDAQRRQSQRVRRAFAPLASSPDAYKRREALTNQITKLAAQYDRTDDEEKKKKILKDIEALKAQRDAPVKEVLETSINEDGHTDVPSAMRKLKTATEDAMQILHALEGHHDQELPSWWMSKLTLAADYLNKARDYLLVPSETMEE